MSIFCLYLLAHMLLYRVYVIEQHLSTNKAKIIVE